MLEFFFDVSSPWTYLAFHNVMPLAQRVKTSIRWRPILVGGVFNSVNPSVYASRENPVPAKQRYMLKDMQDWARAAGLTIKFPPTVFPVNSVKAMRACLVLDDDPAKMVGFARAAFEAYWRDDQDISQDQVIRSVCERSGVDAGRLLAAIGAQSVKDRLKANTQELIERGGFGSPTIFVNRTDMYFGNDRLDLVEAALNSKGIQ